MGCIDHRLRGVPLGAGFGAGLLTLTACMVVSVGRRCRTLPRAIARLNTHGCSFLVSVPQLSVLAPVRINVHELLQGHQ